MSDIILLAVGVAISWAIAKWFYQKTVPIKRLSWTSELKHFVDSKAGPLKNIDLAYNSKTLLSPRLEAIYVWNSGTETIMGSDLSQVDSLRVVYENAEIVEVCDVSSSRKSVLPEAHDISSNEVGICFDFLDPGDGIRLSILFDTRENRYRCRGCIEGSVRGLTHGISSESFLEALYPRTRIGLVIGSVVGSVFLLLTVSLRIDRYLTFNWNIFSISKIFAALTSAMVVIMTFSIAFEGRVTSARVPSALLRGQL